MLAYEGVEREDPALSAVVGPEDQDYIFDGSLERERPEDAGNRPVDNLFGDGLIHDNRLHYIEWRCTDIAVYNAERHQKPGGRYLVNFVF